MNTKVTVTTYTDAQLENYQRNIKKGITVDDEFIELLYHHNWTAIEDKFPYRAFRLNGKRSSEYLNRLIISLKGVQLDRSKVITAKNGNKFDCRFSNLVIRSRNTLYIRRSF